MSLSAITTRKKNKVIKMSKIILFILYFSLSTKSKFESEEIFFDATHF